jgi:hypothetical protein
MRARFESSDEPPEKHLKEKQALQSKSAGSLSTNRN